MQIKPLWPSKVRLLDVVVGIAGLAVLSMAAGAAVPSADQAASDAPTAQVLDEKAPTRATKHFRCEPRTKVCVYRSTPARQHVPPKKPPAQELSKRRCEPITKVCIHRPTKPNPVVVDAKPSPNASKRNRCEPITKACIYR